MMMYSRILPQSYRTIPRRRFYHILPSVSTTSTSTSSSSLPSLLVQHRDTIASGSSPSLATTLSTPITTSVSNSNVLTPPVQQLLVLQRSYISRAHRRTGTEEASAVGEALEDVLTGVKERMERREKRWEKYKDQRAKAGRKDDGPYRNQDETIELVLNLNLDPRKPGQSIRGSLSLPHGTGKRRTVAAFISDTDTETISHLQTAGAKVVGGSDLIRSIADGETPLDFDRVVSTPDMIPSLSKIARVLGPKGLMPSAKLGTIRDVDEIVDAVKKEVEGMVQYRAEKEGIVHLGVGKGSFGKDRLLENIRTVLGEIHRVKPESYGKGKKNKKNNNKGGGSSNKGTKYFLKAYLTATQGKSVNLDLRTVDPTSNFYMESVVN